LFDGCDPRWLVVAEQDARDLLVLEVQLLEVSGDVRQERVPLADGGNVSAISKSPVTWASWSKAMLIPLRTLAACLSGGSAILRGYASFSTLFACSSKASTAVSSSVRCENIDARVLKQGSVPFRAFGCRVVGCFGALKGELRGVHSVTGLISETVIHDLIWLLALGGTFCCLLASSRSCSGSSGPLQRAQECADPSSRLTGFCRILFAALRDVAPIEELVVAFGPKCLN
jgi:hypothetical protein